MKKSLMGYDIDDVLDLARLRRQPSMLAFAFPAIGLLVVGIVIGVGVGILFAPSSGRHLRQAARDRLNQMRDRRKSSEHHNQAAANGTP
jgi:hypothetical protein